MPFVDITNPKVINFLIENYEKESYSRLKWNSRHEEEIRKAATFRGEPKNYTPDDVNKYLMVAGITAIKRDHAEAARHRFVTAPEHHLQAQVSTAKPTEPAMKHVQANEKDLLFESRKDYLKARNKKAPEDKFNFVECDSWKYGWQLEDSDMRAPTHGVVSHMMHSLRSRVFPTPDPEHYASPDGPRTFCESM